MTFEEWTKTGKRVESVAPECDINQPGYVYEGGFIVIDPAGGFFMPICQDEFRANTLPDAERILWDEWVKHECGWAAT